MASIVPALTDLNQTRLAELVEAEADLGTGEGSRVLQVVLDLIGRHLEAGYRVKLTNFGTFETYERAVGLNGLPEVRAAVGAFPEKVRVARFKPTGLLADSVRDGRPIITLRKRAKGSISH
jgi:nucleoid DNA-binding protein